MTHKESDNRWDNSGTYYWKTTDVTKLATVKVGEMWYCDDVDPGWGSDNAFYLRKVKQMIPGITGTEYNSSGEVLKQFLNYPVGYRPIPPPASQWDVPSFAELHNICVRVAAKTSPNRADISVPTSLGELRDIPRLVQNAGHALLKACASGYLSWRFCLKPMIGDLRRLSHFTSSVQKRFALLTKMSRRNLVTGLVPLERYETTSDPSDVTLHSEGVSVSASRAITYKRRAWATIRWRLLVEPPLDVMSRYDLAERLVTGITSYGALETAWNLQPWSWLADWSLNLSDWIVANNNTIPAIAGGFCWMCTDSSESQYTNVQCPSWVALESFPTEGEVRKYRLVPGTSPLIPPVPVLPALTAGQASILGALALLKIRLPTRFTRG